MNIQRPVTRLPIIEAPGFWPGLRAFCLLTLGAAIIGSAALAAPAPGDNPAAAAGKAVVTTGFVGSETCATCHDEVAKDFADNPHTKMSLLHGNAAGVTCENCHGAGQGHVEGGGDVTKIFDPVKATPKQVNETCLKCHAGSHPNFDRSPHDKAGLSCISCHSIHGGNVQLPGQTAAKVAMRLVATPTSAPTGEDKEKLLKASQPTLCFQCHNDVKPQFSMPFHHKVNEGAVQCSDCHDVHGTFENNNLRSTADQNAVCTKCHSEKRGPFIYEHAAVKGEGCLSCHTPHGSQNARLLNVPSINVLCNQCHSLVATNTVHNFTWSQSSDITPCIDCHTMIHGSNLDPAFLR